MTAVASPPSLQPLQRIGWNNEDVQDDVAGISQDGVSRIILTRKILQRSNSSSSISSDSSANTTISTNPSTGTTGTEATSASLAGVGRGGRPQAADREAWSGTKKPKSLWPAYRGEGAFGGSSSGSGAVRQFNFSSGGGSGLNGSHPSSVSIAENMQNVQQAGGGRVLPHAGGSEPQALLILVPTNGTFERKSISVPLFPEILRIGRQTNAKTIPTPTNGFFDSKVLSRQHAEVWADRNGKIWIRDVKSSNGTFVNGQRLSPESRDSEPHELQENFSLELGIDIVSEDQKSIVHHKVSAKVEHAGFPNSSANVMDLTFGDLDPGVSNGLLNSMPNGLNPRPRLGSQASIGSNGSRFDGQAGVRNSGLGVQRHMNSFLSPVSIETVMRKLNAELRQARQQSQDISRTNEFFKALLATEPGQEPPKAPASILPPKPQSPAPPHTNGLMPTSKLEHLSPFSAPPAPPPQLPLPEKPDAPKPAHVDMNPAPFKRSITDNSHPNGKADNSSQILSLVETLHSTRKELDVQSNRIKELEELLKHERKAREMAEERARMLSSRHRSPSDPEHVTPVTPPEDEMSVPLVNGTKEGDDMSDTASEADTVIIERPIEDLVGHVSKGVDAELAVTALQEKLNKMVQDMEEAKKQLDQQRERAVSAETERDNLVDMVQRIRHAETGAKKPSQKSSSSREPHRSERDSHGMLKNTDDLIEDSRAKEDSDIEEIVREADALIAMNGKPPGSGTEAAKDKQIRELQESLAKALARAKRTDQLVGQSTPYISMLGVVILGVSAMLYLNSFQKSEK